MVITPIFKATMCAGPGYTLLNKAYSSWLLKTYINNGKTVVIWNNRNILARDVMISPLWKLFKKF